MEKISTATDKLRELILSRAAEQKKILLAKAETEAREWLSSETEKLGDEIEQLVTEAGRNAGETRKRSLQNAERECMGETLRLRNKLLRDATQLLAEKLAQLRSRDDYAQILCGMALEAAETLQGTAFSFSLAAVDFPYAENLTELLKTAAPNMTFVFDKIPAAITGGLILCTEDKKRMISSDWQSIARETADTLAQRLPEPE